MAGLLALVADLLAAARRSGAVARQVTGDTAVVALVAVHAVAYSVSVEVLGVNVCLQGLTREMADAAARVAGLLAEAAAAAAAVAATAVATATAAVRGATLAAVASDVADLTALGPPG